MYLSSVQFVKQVSTSNSDVSPQETFVLPLLKELNSFCCHNIYRSRKEI